MYICVYEYICMQILCVSVSIIIFLRLHSSVYTDECIKYRCFCRPILQIRRVSVLIFVFITSAFISVHMYSRLCVLIDIDVYKSQSVCLFLSVSHFFYLSVSCSRFVHRYLTVGGNPLGCVQGVPDSVTHFDTFAVYFGYYETARCGDNCTEHTVFVPSDGVCVQCPDGTHAHGVGALNCSVLSSIRWFLVHLLCCSVLQCATVWYTVRVGPLSSSPVFTLFLRPLLLYVHVLV